VEDVVDFVYLFRGGFVQAFEFLERGHPPALPSAVRLAAHEPAWCQVISRPGPMYHSRLVSRFRTTRESSGFN
jgi:hypothetical protein